MHPQEPQYYCLPPQLEEDHGKLTVVLDLDETLIHSELITTSRREKRNVKSEEVFYLLGRDGEGIQVEKRPFLDEFLAQAAEQFELIVFTAGSANYAGPLLDVLDPQRKYFKHRLFREHCYGKHFLKDLRVVNRQLEKTVLVDNTYTSFLFQVRNGIPISSYYGGIDRSDKALLVLLKFLELLKHETDVRDRLRHVFKLETVLNGFTRDELMKA
jgi:CTD small phosphatase-like protein 2